MELPQVSAIESAIAKVALRLSCVSSEEVEISQALGRVLVEPLRADRDSPPMNVSAMDGYALRLADLQSDTLPVADVAYAGRPPICLTAGQAVQIFTGAAVPDAADCVVRREDTIESPGQVKILIPPGQLRQGQNIRFRGENIVAGELVLPGGTQLATASIGALATFGPRLISVRKKVLVSLLTSGDELVEPGQPAQLWQIRDSNGMTLLSWLSRLPWTEVVSRHRVGDTLELTKRAIEKAYGISDVVLLTGGVSAGDTDYIPEAITALGGQIVFHRLPVRPGKPALAAVLDGKLIVGLPGNPVSTAVMSRLIAEPLLERLAGQMAKPIPTLMLSDPDEKTLDLIWYRLVEVAGGSVRLVDSRGSGDLVSMSRSHGFVEQLPGKCGAGPWRAWFW